MTDSILPVAILAGGLATRLRPLTEAIPKSMVMVANEPFIAHQLRLLAKQGVRRVVICCGFLGEQIEEYVKDGSAFGCEVEFSSDGTPLKGTGGAIRKALPLLGEQFFVLYGDSYLPVDYRPIQDTFLRKNSLGLMTVFKNQGRWDRSNVEYADGRILDYHKKIATPHMQYIDYGLGLFRQEAFANWRNEEAFDLSDLYRRLLQTGRLEGFEVMERFYEIGTQSGLSELQELMTGAEAYNSE